VSVVVLNTCVFPHPPERIRLVFTSHSKIGDLRDAVCKETGYSSDKFDLKQGTHNLDVIDDGKTIHELSWKQNTLVMVLGKEGFRDPDVTDLHSPPISPIQAIPIYQKGCGICFEEDGPFSELDCHHEYCFGCLRRYLASEFDEKGKSFLDLKCPQPKCTQKITQEQLQAFGSEETVKNFESVLKTIPQNPQDPYLSISDFCYEFTSENVLQHRDTGAKFHWVNQVHYDLLGDLIVPYIQQRMMNEFGMEEVQLPIECELPAHMRSNIFMTPDALTNKDKLMLLIQGSGAVRPGQWARALCINDSLDTGAIFGYLQRARDHGYGVIVFNPNLNAVSKELQRPSREDFFVPGKPRPLSSSKDNADFIRIPHNSTPGEHTLYVWDNFVRKAAADKLVIVAHSAGGVCTIHLLKNRDEEVLPRLKAIAFTDSVHLIGDPRHIQTFINENAINWIQSDKPLDTPEKLSSDGCPCVSSGANKHELTSASAIESVFKFLESKVNRQ